MKLQEVRMKPTVDKKYKSVERSTQLTDGGNSEKQSDEINTQECPSAENVGIHQMVSSLAWLIIKV